MEMSTMTRATIEHALGLAIALPEDRENYITRRELIDELRNLWKAQENA